MCLEREIGVEAHCQHSRRSHTLSVKPPCSENVSGVESMPALLHPVFFLLFPGFVLFVPR